jgi:hypothetical protein
MSVLVGGAQPALAGDWNDLTIVQVLDAILFPDLLPTYTIPTLTLSSSVSGTQEIGSTVSQNLTLTGTKNDAGAFTALSVSRDVGAGSGVLSSTTSPTIANATDIDDQYGYSDPNNPNKTYTLSYNDSYVVVSGTTTWSGSGDYSAGSAKQNNKNVTDARTAALRTTTAPQSAGSNFASDSDTVTGIYPYYWGVSSTQPTAASIATAISSGVGANKVLASASGTVSVTFNASSEYVWMAHAASYTNKTKWYNTGLNNGSIGAGQFILAPVQYNVDSHEGYWSSVSFDIYISSGATQTSGAIEFRNS